MGMAGNNDFFIQNDDTNAHRIPGGITKAKHILPCFQHIGGIILPVAGDGFQVEREFQFLPLTGIQNLSLFKGGQLLIFLVQLSVGCGNIKLCNFCAGVGAAGVCYIGFQPDGAAIQRNTGTMDGEIRITEAKTEGIGRFHTEAVKITVSYIDTLLIVFVLQIAVEVTVLIGKGNVRILFCPGIGKFAGGCHLSADNVSKGVAALSAKLADVQNSIDAGNLFCEGHVDGAAAVDDQHKMLIMCGAETNGSLFFLGQEHITGLCLPVSTLTCLPAQHINAGIGITGGYILFRDGPAGGKTEIIEEHLHDGVQFHNIDPLFLFLLIGLLGSFEAVFIIGKPHLRGDVKSPVFQTFQNRHAVTFIDFAGAGAALDGLDCSGTVESDFLCFERQGAIVFQKHHSLAGSLIGNAQIIKFPLIGFRGEACFC